MDQKKYSLELVQNNLKKLFGYSSFRPNQEEVIFCILEGRDTFTVMPTGGGKSICYQLPAYLMPGTCVVVSPLISLMKDQVDGALENGLKAALLNSSLSLDEVRQVEQDILAGHLDLLYIAPERFANERFQMLLKDVTINLFAIDEAHCISEWGHDFRPDYLNLKHIRQHFPNVAIAAFTATATQNVQNDIVQKLNLMEPEIRRASFDRSNLFLEVKPKENIQNQILNIVQQKKNKAGNVYRMTRNDVEKTANFLNAHNIAVLPYHAGMSGKQRSSNQNAFNNDQIQVIVATIAFGMGIDKSNVRFIIHGDLPKNLEGYYQEIGRAGRDGDAAECILFYRSADIHRVRFFMDQIPDAQDKAIAENKMQKMIQYASLHKCRRIQILQYFDEVYPREECSYCDVCTGLVETENATTEAQMVLSAIHRVRQSFGAGQVVDIVTGAKTQKIFSYQHDKLKTYGVGKHRDKRYWRQLIEELLSRNIIKQLGSPYPVLGLTKSASDILKGEQEFFITKTKQAHKAGKAVLAMEKPLDPDLFEKLRLLRRSISDQLGVPPYIVFSDKTLREMCVFLPTDREKMLLVNGVGFKKFEQYGDQFLRVIREHIT